MKLCDSRKHFIPNLSKPVTAAYSGETENTNLNFFVWPIKGELSVGPWDWTLAVGGNIYVHIHMQ